MLKNDNEAPFNFDELFFSRTDARGYIQSGNSLFQKINEFSWEELLDRPHNVIRHPEMPKGVFHLFWNKLKAGQTVGAFVKNRTKSGKYYWVYALAMPIEQGFVSLRIKPCGKIFEAVKEEYGKLLTLEKSRKLSPEASHQQLLQDLSDLGFKSYDSFMIEGLMQSLELREQQLKRLPIRSLVNLNTFLDEAKTIMEKTIVTLQSYKESAFVGLNLEIQTYKMGETAAPLAMVAGKYDAITKEIQTGLKDFKIAGELVLEKVVQSQFDICSGILQNEMVEKFKNEISDGTVDSDREMKTLIMLRKTGLEKSVSSLRDVEREFMIFRQSCENLKTLSTDLEIVRLMGRIEVAKISGFKTVLEAMMEMLQNFHKSLTLPLSEIEQAGGNLRSLAGTMIKDISASV